MNKGLNIALVVLMIFLLLFLSGAFYIIDETKQVMITRFGEPLGEPKTKAGLYIKFPFADTAHYFEKRTLEWDGDAKEIQTSEKRYIWVDATARWRIVDALKFMKSVRTEISAQSRLDQNINSATRDVIAKYKLAEIVRDSNRLLSDEVKSQSKQDDFDLVDIEPIKSGREKLSREILNQAAQETAKYGIELVDVRIKRINYVESVRKSVYDRMISERKAAASRFRSEGQGERAKIEGQMSKELKKIESDAYKKAQEIKGLADAKAVKIYADAYNKDPEFYAFLKSLESYQQTMDKETTLILTTDNEYYHQLNSSLLLKE